MPLIETDSKASDRGHSRNLVKKAEVIDFATSGVEKVVAVIKVDGYGKKTFIYVNKSAAQNHDIKVYASVYREIPDSLADTNLKEIHSSTINLGVTSNPLVFHNEYHWLVFTSDGVTEADIADLSFIGTNNG